MPVFTFLFMNSIIGASSFILTYKVFKIPAFVDSLICWFILFCAQIISSELILGIWGALYLRNIILLNLIVLMIIWYAAKNELSSFNLKPFKESLPVLLKNKIILLAACVILCFGAVKIFINLTNPPFGWDSLNYHFTFAVEWLKHANLENPIIISDDPSPSYYPIGGSLFFLWLIFPFKSVFLADIGQIPFFVLTFLATYSISRKICLNKESSFYAAALFLVIPNFFKQLQIAYVDVMLGALFLTCLNSLFLLSKDFSFKGMLLYSMSLGLFLSTKTVALPYSVLLILPFLYLSLKNSSRAYLSIASIFAVIAIGGFSYIRNFVETGNPLYPLDFSLFGKYFFKGVIDAGTYRAHFKIEDYRISKLLFHEGLGFQSLAFILPSTLLALPVALLKKRKTLTFNLAYFLVLPILMYLIYRYIIPLANVRYLYSFLGLGIILGLYTAKNLNIPGRVINILVLLCILSSIGELAKRQELVISIVSTLAVFPAAAFLIKHKPKILIKKSLFIPVISILMVILLIVLQRDYGRNEYPRYIKMVKYSGFWPDAARGWDWLNKNTKGDNIAYAGRPVPFPLYGANFKNNVYYVSVNKTEPAKLHYFPGSHYHWDYDFLSLHRNLESEGNYRGGADYSVWLNNLARRNTDYLFIYSLHQTKDLIFPLEDNWAKAHPAKFNLAFVNQTVHIYRIIR